jgi:serine/threonine-protein kinase
LSQLELVSVDELAAVPAVGSVLDGKFRIDGVLGQGGMAVVLAATHLQLEQRVAIKLLLPECAEDPEAVARFLLEGRAASKIRSEHVVRVLDVGVDDIRPYLVMEYLDGTDLDALIARDGPLPSVLAVDYLLQACEAIAEAHVSGIIHRDLKPANLFLTHHADGTACVKVLDFGISKILRSRNSALPAHETSPLLLMGSPHYMSPEQMKSARNVDQRSDLWSLGAILHELVAGKPPFDGVTITALCAAIMTEEPPPLASPRGDLPHDLGAVVLRCLAKEPADRFANVAELAAALAPFGSDAARSSALCIARVLNVGSDTSRAPRSIAVPAAPPVAEPVLADEPRRSRTHVGRLAGFVAVLVAGVAWMLIQKDHATPDAESTPRAPTVTASPTPARVLPSSASVSGVPSATPSSPPHRHVPVVPAETSNPASVAPRADVANPVVAPTPGTAPSERAVADDDGSADNPY